VESFQTRRTVLVPIFGGDITDETVAAAKAFLARPGSRLVLLFVVPALEGAFDSRMRRAPAGAEPRWHCLASAAAPDRTFVEVVVGDPADVVLTEAARFHSGVIVFGAHTSVGPADAWIDRTIRQLLTAAPREVYIANRPARSQRTTRRAYPRTPRALHPRRSHVQPTVRLAAQAAH
jgi:nucleotide-binding universal stress UspA family protein